MLVIASFAYPEFAKRMRVPSRPTKELYRDPFDILGFILAHIGIVIVLVGLIFPAAFNYLICEDEGSTIESEKHASSPEDSMEEDVESCNNDSTHEVRDSEQNS